MHDPRGTPEPLALLLLDRAADFPPVALDDAGHIGRGRAFCTALALELVSPPDGAP
jgi:hypothetical protein